MNADRHARTLEVPSAIVPADNAFAVSQVLVWLAKERRHVDERLERMMDIPNLIKKLIKPAKAVG